MKVGNNYKIESDEMNITLYKKSIIKKGTRAGRESWTALGYYSTVKNALRGLANMKLRESGLKDLITVSKRQDEIYKLIEGLGR